MAVVCKPPGVSDDCLPGCWNHEQHHTGGGGARWCHDSVVIGCPYKPEDFGRMMSTHATLGGGHNEVIIDAHYYMENLPQSVEAIYGDAKVHRAFLKHYGVTADEVPLITHFG